LFRQRLQLAMLRHRLSVPPKSEKFRQRLKVFRQLSVFRQRLVGAELGNDGVNGCFS